MEVSSYSLSNHEHSSSNSVMMNDDSIDEYLDDPNLSISDMIEKYDVPVIIEEKKKEKKALCCTVCGATAFGYNFDQISCESCKAFFRRNALKNTNELRCRFSGNCNITVNTRRHCSYCRIQKCFTVGMRKEWIRSEEEKHMKRLQQEKIRRRKHTQKPIEIPGLMPSVCSNNSGILSSIDRVRLNNITHCYDQFTGEPSSCVCDPASKLMSLRVDEFFNRKRPIFVNLITYFKNLPELQTLNMNDQVSLIKQNIRLIIPLNYAVLKTRKDSKFGNSRIQTIGCANNANLHLMFRSLSDLFFEFTVVDPMIIKILIIVLFFTSNALTTRSVYDPAQYDQLGNIKQIQSSYTELLWIYMLEKCGEEHAIHLFTKMITKYLHILIVMDEIDSIIQLNNDSENIDSLMKTMLQLT